MADDENRYKGRPFDVNPVPKPEETWDEYIGKYVSLIVSGKSQNGGKLVRVIEGPYGAFAKFLPYVHTKRTNNGYRLHLVETGPTLTIPLVDKVVEPTSLEEMLEEIRIINKERDKLCKKKVLRKRNSSR